MCSKVLPYVNAFRVCDAFFHKNPHSSVCTISYEQVVPVENERADIGWDMARMQRTIDCFNTIPGVEAKQDVEVDSYSRVHEFIRVTGHDHSPDQIQRQFPDEMMQADKLSNIRALVSREVTRLGDEIDEWFHARSLVLVMR